MVLCNNLDSIMMVEYSDIRMLLDSFDQTKLDLRTGVVLMMKYAEFGMAAFTMKVELAIFFLVKVHSPFDKPLYLAWCLTYNHFDRFAIIEPIAGNHCIFNMLIKIIYFQI